jgi:D-threonate/D-erythronate kinase
LSELLIIADDLTGAIEAGVQLSKQGIPAEVVVDADSGFINLNRVKKIPALVVNTESRHIPPEAAAGRILKVINSVKDFGFKFFYKKTDSTMRGNIGAELDAFSNGTNSSVIPYFPAHPKAGRFTKKGYQYVGETLLHQTSFSRDPLNPVSSSYVPGILQQQTKMEICLADPGGISSDEDVAASGTIVVFDCESEVDLQIAGDTIVKKGWQNATAGTAGFVEILLKILPLSYSEIKTEAVEGPVLIINGSMNPVSLQQVGQAKKSGVMTLFLSRDLIMRPDFKSSVEYRQIIDEIQEAFSNKQNVIVSTFDPADPESFFQKENFHSGTFSEKAGKVIYSIIQKVPFKILCVFGGDTLMGIIKETGSDSIEAVSEIVPGVAFTKVQTNSGTLHLFSKPGGYGGKDVILKIIQNIKDVY